MQKFQDCRNHANGDPYQEGNLRQNEEKRGVKVVGSLTARKDAEDRCKERVKRKRCRSTAEDRTEKCPNAVYLLLALVNEPAAFFFWSQPIERKISSEKERHSDQQNDHQDS